MVKVEYFDTFSIFMTEGTIKEETVKLFSNKLFDKQAIFMITNNLWSSKDL